jgi:hypothetical protein
MRRLLVYALPLLGACYAYAPIEPAAVPAGAGVRARVSGAGADRIAPLLGTADARVLDGRLVDVRADTLIVEVPTVTQASLGGAPERLHQRVSIPRADLLELETRRLDRLRTAAVVGTAVVVVGAVALRALKNDPGSSSPPGPGGPGEVLIPLGRLLRLRP